MLIFRSEDPQFLANAYLIADESTGKGVLVDSNFQMDPLLEVVDRHGIEIEAVLLTHHHWDHVVEIGEIAAKYGAKIHAHELCKAEIDAVDETWGDGDALEAAGIRFEALHTPGHCGDHLAIKVGDGDCLTADVLFKGTCGGTGAPGATGIDDLRNSVMEKLMKLPHETRIHPGHKQPSTIGDEWENNPFVRVWRGIDELGSDPVSVGPADLDPSDRREAELLLWAPDYDGGNKAWVRFADDGSETITGGSQIKREN